MNHLPSLITDLAIILILGSVFSLICKILKQPVVLGYIIAGFIAVLTSLFSKQSIQATYQHGQR